MRRIIAIALLAGAAGSEGTAQDAPPATNSPPAMTEPSGSGLLSPDESSQYVSLKLEETRLESRLKLVNELADEHQKRAEAAMAGRLETEKWEIASAQELRARAVAITRQLNEAIRRRLAFEESHIAPIISILGPGSLEPSGSMNPYELAYVFRLEKRSATVTGEWLAAIDNSKNYTMQLGTNRVPEDMDRISFQLNESTRQARELEKELSDLELRKLEFRALRKQPDAP